MSKIRVGHFLGKGTEDLYLPLGFIPDYFRMCDIDYNSDNVAVQVFEWFERMEDDESGGRQEGWSFDASTNYITLLSNGAGISAYDTGLQFPPSGFDSGELAEWAGTTAVDVKTGTKSGSYAKPTVGATDDTGSVVDREAIFENVGASDGSTGSSEPTWPSAIGGQVVDSSAIWEKVNTPTFRGGYQGVCIANEIQTDTHEYYYIAIKADESIDHGDVDGWVNGIDPNWS